MCCCCCCLSGGNKIVLQQFCDLIMSLIISNEQLINEIKKRPTLYDKNLDDYNDRKIRLKLWNQICHAMIPKWNELLMTERLLRRKEIQSRWKNLRSCFWRDYNCQKNEKLLGLPNKKRRWLFFTRLSFLLTPEQKLLINNQKTNCDQLINDDHDDVIDDMNDCMETEINYHPSTTTILPIRSSPLTETPTPPPPQQQQQQTNQTTIIDEKSKLYNELINTVKQQSDKFNDEIDEEKMFLLSLLPIMRKFNDEQKFVAKIEILDLIRRIQLYQLTTIPTNHNYDNLITTQKQQQQQLLQQDEIQIDDTIKVEDDIGQEEIDYNCTKTN